MKVTIQMDEDLYSQAKQAALEMNCTLSAVFEDALRLALSRKNQKSKQKQIRLPSSGKGGLKPGVNLDSSASLLDFMS